ncbi:MAG: DUF1972 domain-containing protein [Salinarimonas sp.]|nr:DUF1972 domain-containing protein [Salinarimonas sp.]
MKPAILILGTRGVPAAHGGFETFAEKLSLYLAAAGYRVIVYCQEDVDKVTQRFTYDMWEGVERVKIEISRKGPLGTLEFDLHSILEARNREGVCLVLGYNTAALLPLLRSRNRPILTNMDGMEWKRDKWSAPVRAWLRANERIAIWSSNQLVADHPAIADYLGGLGARAKTTMIPYGADPVESADGELLRPFGIEPNRYVVSIARIEPENGILTAVRAWREKPRYGKLVVLGKLDPQNDYHRMLVAEASDDVVFPGAIYTHDTIAAIRYFSRAYFHGHRVGGTNPSLVEALAAGCPVLAHDNVFNRWTAGEGQFFFSDETSCADAFERIFNDDAALAAAKVKARARAAEAFRWNDVLSTYEDAMLELAGGKREAPAAALLPVRVRNARSTA